jgi:predicted helicase
MPKIFPANSLENRAICMNGVGAQKEFSVLMVDKVPDLHALQTGQCFPLYLYDKVEADEQGVSQVESASEVQSSLFETEKQKNCENGRHHAITDEGLAHFKEAYPEGGFSKEDLFYYVYGLLHSADYRERYADNFTKELPRIPCVKSPADFWAFSQAGRKLADLHINYETVKCYPTGYAGGALLLNTLEREDFRVEKMKFGKKKEDGKNVDDKTTVIYNHKVTMTGIPLEAYDYVVNGKPALEWVMERQAVTTHKESGIVNDANLWATETVGDAKYPLELFQRVITVSLETIKIVKALPKLEVQVK